MKNMIDIAYVTLHGDPSVGIQSGTITISDLNFDLDVFDTPLDSREFLRDTLSKCFADLYGERPSVVFDDEVQDY